MHCFLPDFRHSISNCFKYILLPSPPGSRASNCEPKKGNPFCLKLLLPGILSQKEKKSTLEGSQLDGREKLLGGETKEPFIHSQSFIPLTHSEQILHAVMGQRTNYFSIRREKRNILGRGKHMYTLLQESFWNKHSDTEARIAPERLPPGSNLLFHVKL